MEVTAGLEIITSNFTNPTFLFFLLGITAALIKSDLEIPAQSVKFISLYLLFAIGFKGGQELTKTPIDTSVLLMIAAAFVLSSLIPIYVFFVMRIRASVSDAAAIAATYGSVSAVTFVAAGAFLEALNIPFGGHMVAIMALMEAPAIIVATLLISYFDPEKGKQPKIASIIAHSFTNGSVLLILGSLAIGFISESKQAEGLRPFTTDIFKGFLALFLLDMGITTAKRLGAFWKYGFFASAMAVVFPLINGVLVAYLSRFVTDDTGDRFMLTVLAASASYIAVPAAMKLSAPRADPGLFVPMAIGVTFPFNITVGLPLYLALIRLFP
jgi:hypothetical protein